MRSTLCLGLAASASATVYFQESFADGWDSKWVTSGAKDAKELGEFKHVAPKFCSDDKGIKTGEGGGKISTSVAFRACDGVALSLRSSKRRRPALLIEYRINQNAHQSSLSSILNLNST